MPNTDKQKLDTSIAAAVTGILTSAFETLAAHTGAEFASLATQNSAEFASINSICSALLARVEVIEQFSTSSGGAKRALRGERKTGGAPVAKADGDDDQDDKIKNSMLYTRRMWANEEEFRTKYLTEAVQTEIDGDDKTTKHPADTEARRLAEGSLFWRKCATTQQKSAIRDEFTRWLEERKRGQLAEQLDDGDDTVDNANDSGPRY